MQHVVTEIFMFFYAMYILCHVCEKAEKRFSAESAVIRALNILC